MIVNSISTFEKKNVIFVKPWPIHFLRTYFVIKLILGDIFSYFDGLSRICNKNFKSS